MPRPPSTKEGRTSTGSRPRRPTAFASSNDDAMPIRRGEAGRGKHAAERAALLGEVDRLRARCRRSVPGGLQPVGQAQRGLAAELADDPGDGPLELGVDDLEHVLGGQRLEVQPGGGVVVGGDRLRVAVDHHRLVADLAQGLGGVDAAVVELDALADAVGPEPSTITAGTSRGSTSAPRRRRRRSRGSWPRTRRRRCPPSCTPAGCPARGAPRARRRSAGSGPDLGVGEAVPLGQSQQLGGEHRVRCAPARRPR